MKSYAIWFTLFWSILTLFVAIIARLKESAKLGTLLWKLFEYPREIYLWLNEKYELITLKVPEESKDMLFVSSYNFRSFLSSLPFFKNLPISNKNRFVKAYIYDYEKRISSNNYLVNSSIPFEKKSREVKK
jgi:hypothetical protein